LKYRRASAGNQLCHVVRTSTIGRTFVDEYQAQIVSRRILFVDLPKRGCKVETAEEESDRDRLSCILVSIVLS
jgi:hypothetical protein